MEFHRIGNAIEGSAASPARVCGLMIAPIQARRGRDSSLMAVSGACDSQTLTFKARLKSGDKERPVPACLLVT